jgi:hypothetical protein
LKPVVRLRWVAGLVAVAVVALQPLAASAREPFAHRLLTTGPQAPARFEPAPSPNPGGQLSTPTDVRSTTVDSEPWTGYENAVYAPGDDTVFVAFKRFTEDPDGGGYNQAELRVAKSIDGGATWTIHVVDPDAIEAGDTIDNSVSIDGNGDAVYIAYHVRSSGLFADMKLMVARSTDAGGTWTIDTVADGYAGDHNSIRVLDANSVAISAHANGPEEGVHLYTTRNGGSTWTDSLVEGGFGNGYYTSVGATSPRRVFVAWYNSLYPDHTDLNAARRALSGWRTTTVDGEPGDLDLAGLGASIWVAAGPTAWIAYEADTAEGAFVRVARWVPGVPGWTIVPVQQGGTIGWNTSVHAVGTSDVYVGYWRIDDTGAGRAMLAVSADGGATWSPLAIPDAGYVQPYLDSSAPSTAVQYESYQTTDLSGDHEVLRVARVRP